MGVCCACCNCFKAEPAFPRSEGRSISRGITDLPFCIAFLVFLAGMALCVLSGIWWGNPKRLTHGAQWDGQICGEDEGVKANKFMMFCGSPERDGEFPKFIIEGDAWPLFAISAAIAGILGGLYLFLLQRCAGMLIMVTMIFSTLFTLAAGFFFFVAIVLDTDDATSTYSKFNPIMSTYIGAQAKAYSVTTGVVLILFGVIFTCFTATSLRHIDECVGLIDAACEPFRKPGSVALWLYPVFMGVSYVLLAAFFILYALPIVASLGGLENSEIEVNGIAIPGYQRVWTKNWIQTFEFWYFFVGMFFLLEVYVQLGHYIVAYTISCWYFTPATKHRKDNNKLLKTAVSGIGKRVDVRVAGVDAYAGSRHGTVVGGDGSKFLVVPVDKKVAGISNDLMEVEYLKPEGPSMTNMAMGGASALFYHAGSLALGAPIICIFRPFRMASQIVSSLLARTAHDEHGVAHAEDPHSANLKGCLSLMAACMEQVFGKYSKNAYTELVLGGKDGFMACSENSFQHLVKSGGSVAHLHGSMLVYEIFGGLCVTLTSGWTVLILQDKLDMFNEPGGSYYIEDKTASAITAMIIAFAVSFSWMSVWNQTADVLLYCVAWNRRQVHEGEEHHLLHKDLIKEVEVFCPQTIRNLLPAYELQAAHEHGLHAHGLGQQGAIIAAMEHGAMSAPGGTGGAPDYGKSVAGAHAMATKIIG